MEASPSVWDLCCNLVLQSDPVNRCWPARSRALPGAMREGFPQGQSSLIPADRITLCQRATSCLRNRAVSSGELPTGVAEKSCSFFARSGSWTASAIAVESLAAISGGVFGGAATPNQVTDTNPGNASDTVGTWGSVGKRPSLVTPSAFSLPLLICGSASLRLTNIMSTCPPIRSVSAAGTPLYG